MSKKDPRFDPALQKNIQQVRDENRIVGNEIAFNTILTNHIAAGVVTGEKLSADSVSTVNIVNNAVTTAKIADGSITNAKIADGQITDAKMTTGVQQRLANGFIKKQIVNRRPIITEAVGPYSVIYLNAYGPFSYNVPGVQPGAERRYRIYAVYSDNVTANQGAGGGSPILVSFTMYGDNTYYGYYGGNYNGPVYGTFNFYLPYTWGDSAIYRDAVSNEIVGISNGNHVSINIGPYYDYSGRTIKVLYMEIQTLDVFP